MRKALSVPIVLLAGLGMTSFSSAALAADAKGNFALRGIGAQTCQLMVKQQTPATANELAAWLGGYLSALNRLEQNTFDASPVLDPRMLASMVTQICRENGKAMVESAAYDLFRAMAVARLKGNSPIVTAKSGRNVTSLRKDTLFAVQAALVKGGYMNAKPSGGFDAATEAGVRAFQRKQKLAETGVPDPATVLRVLVAPSAR